mmetsp:Transcript_27992/g.39814  ORF Transcript_27992/g.39814 Transcript_27992/m.39814 type:complete len:989 (+) Transcript_27992:106-3072(+)
MRRNSLISTTAAKTSTGPGPEASTRQNVRVICRVRPVNKKELLAGGILCVKHSDTDIEVAVEEGLYNFSFDRVFGDKSNQVEVFNDTAHPLIKDVLSGYNATIFAYGQTGTGKTHTMEGDIHSETAKGIIPRTVEALFDGVTDADENIEFMFKVSYVEIYLEKIRDLLDENHVKNNLTVREDKIKGIYIAGVTEEYVTSVEELLGIMSVGASNRAVAATGMNEGSSRSHSVFTITVSQKDIITNATKSGKLVLVDLAGSEMVRKSNASGQQLEEAKTINKSLSALGQVINALTDEKQTHVPYRDSKLTRVLQDSLGGNSKTVLIVAISPSSYNGNETVSTLRFGMRAKSIENKVQVNQTRSIEELENLLVRAEKAIDAQTAHIMSLSAQLQALQAAHNAREEDTDNDDESEAAAGTENDDHAERSHVERPSSAAMEAVKQEVEAATAVTTAQASVIIKLQEQVAALTQELDEERQESSRKEAELKSFAVLVKDKDKVIHDITSTLTEAQRANDSLRERSEQLLREKIEAVGELTSLKAMLEDDKAKASFNIKELEVSLSTLELENQNLKKEIADMSGDPQQIKNPSRKHPVIEVNNDEMAESVDMSELMGKKVPNNDMRNDSSMAINFTAESGNGGMDLKDKERLVITNEDRKQRLELFGAQFASSCRKYQIAEEPSANLYSIMESFAAEQEMGFVALEGKLKHEDKVHAKRVKELEDQRMRLEKDLQTKVESMIQLQMKYDALGRMDRQQQSDAISDKERLSRKSLQQRLEQLVAVHRQLLRKFASLELETSELKKKTQLRDERIRQLEGSSKGLIGNIRQQAEKHVAELTNLREQIQIMKSEHEQRVESNARNNTNVDSPSSLRGLLKPKALRGGGGVDHRKSANYSSFDRVDGIQEKDEEDYNDDEDDAAWTQKQALASANSGSKLLRRHLSEVIPASALGGLNSPMSPSKDNNSLSSGSGSSNNGNNNGNNVNKTLFSRFMGQK